MQGGKHTDAAIFSVSMSKPAGKYMFKVDNRNTRTRCEICSKLAVKTPERRHSHFIPPSVVFRGYKMGMASFWCLYCWLWTYLAPCSNVFIVNFEQVNAGWETCIGILSDSSTLSILKANCWFDIKFQIRIKYCVLKINRLSILRTICLLALPRHAHSGIKKEFEQFLTCFFSQTILIFLVLMKTNHRKFVFHLIVHTSVYIYTWIIENQQVHCIYYYLLKRPWLLT